VVVEEADESQLWLELLVEAHPRIRTGKYERLTKEAAELTAIFTASHRTATANLRQKAADRGRKRAERQH
jgi:hypothetical protein